MNVNTELPVPTPRLPPHIRTLPGVPIPRGARARRTDIRQRLYDWNFMNELAVTFYYEVVGDITAQAGSALAVAIANGWVALVLELEPPAEQEKLRGAMWHAPLGLERNEYPAWVTLTEHLWDAATAKGATPIQIIEECRRAVRAMYSVATGDYDGQLHRYDDVVVSAMRGVRDAAKRSGFVLDDMAKLGRRANIKILPL